MLVAAVTRDILTEFDTADAVQHPYGPFSWIGCNYLQATEPTTLFIHEINSR